MAAENIKIKVSMFDWSGYASVPYEASVYSGKPYVESTAPFDLIDYLLDESLILSWDFEYIKEGYSSPKLLPMGSQVSLRLSNMDGKIASFFRIHQETALIKWKVKVFYDNALIHEGWVSPEGISYGENAGTGSDTHSLEMRIKDTITGDGPLNNHHWDISSMEIDLINETTSFELISQRLQNYQQNYHL